MRFWLPVCSHKEKEGNLISKEDLLIFNKRGLFPGPNETEEVFLQRARFTLDYVPKQSPDALISKIEWQEPLKKVSSIFGMEPDWAAGYYSDKSLPPWQGAAAWISDDEPPLIQLKKAFRKGSYLRIYKRDEVLAHEAVHASRMAFEEPYFEEMFAYKVSSSPLQRALGALFIRSWEAPALLLLLFACLWKEFFFVPIAGFAFLTIRLLFLHLVFTFCQKRLKAVIKDPGQVLAAILRLSDNEIFLFARLSPEKIRQYIGKQQSFKWLFFRAAYMFDL